MNGVVQGFAVIGIVIFVGYLLGRGEVLGPAAVGVLSRVAFFVASPALLFVTLVHADIHAVALMGFSHLDKLYGDAARNLQEAALDWRSADPGSVDLEKAVEGVEEIFPPSGAGGGSSSSPRGRRRSPIPDPDAQLTSPG